VHENSVVADGQSGCTCGFWIPDSWAGAGKRGGVEDHRGAEGAEGYKYAYHSQRTSGVSALGQPKVIGSLPRIPHLRDQIKECSFHQGAPPLYHSVTAYNGAYVHRRLRRRLGARYIRAIRYVQDPPNPIYHAIADPS